MEAEALLRIENLKKWFRTRRSIKSFFSRKPDRATEFVRAVDGVTFQIRNKETFGLVGESGSGKTTLGKVITKLLEPTAGTIYFEGRDITKIRGKEMKDFRRRVQMIFQDPYGSLTPRMSTYGLLSEPIKVHKLAKNKCEEEKLVRYALSEVDLDLDHLAKYPSELSGGQRQRISIARALILQPRFIIADEPVSMLDISIRAGILRLMLKLRERFGLSELFITHDVATARYICDRIGVMYRGKLVEIGQTHDVIGRPLHPYTIALMSAVPVPDPTVERGEVLIKGEGLNAISASAGCAFYRRCLNAEDVCQRTEPVLVNVGNEHYVACCRHGCVD